MSQLDGTGPFGKGSQTGRGFGNCSKNKLFETSVKTEETNQSMQKQSNSGEQNGNFAQESSIDSNSGLLREFPGRGRGFAGSNRPFGLGCKRGFGFGRKQMRENQIRNICGFGRGRNLTRKNDVIF